MILHAFNGLIQDQRFQSENVPQIFVYRHVLNVEQRHASLCALKLTIQDQSLKHQGSLLLMYEFSGSMARILQASLWQQ